MYVCMDGYMYVCMYACMHAYMYVCIYICVWLCVCMYMYVYMCMYVCVFMYAMCMYLCIYVCVHMFIYKHVCMHALIHVQMRVWLRELIWSGNEDETHWPPWQSWWRVYIGIICRLNMCVGQFQLKCLNRGTMNWIPSLSEWNQFHVFYMLESASFWSAVQ